MSEKMRLLTDEEQDVARLPPSTHMILVMESAKSFMVSMLETSRLGSHEDVPKPVILAAKLANHCLSPAALNYYSGMAALADGMENAFAAACAKAVRERNEDLIQPD